MRWATLLVVCAACNDVRDFAGEWTGARVGSTAAVRVGVDDTATASLVIDDVDTHGLRGRLQVDSAAAALISDAELVSLPGAEADALATMSFAGSPLRVYLSFVTTADGGGDALAMIGLYDRRRIDLRLLRGGATPIYAIFALSQRE